MVVGNSLPEFQQNAAQQYNQGLPNWPPRRSRGPEGRRLVWLGSCAAAYVLHQASEARPWSGARPGRWPDLSLSFPGMRSRWARRGTRPEKPGERPGQPGFRGAAQVQHRAWRSRNDRAAGHGKGANQASSLGSACAGRCHVVHRPDRDRRALHTAASAYRIIGERLPLPDNRRTAVRWAWPAPGRAGRAAGSRPSKVLPLSGNGASQRVVGR